MSGNKVLYRLRRAVQPACALLVTSLGLNLAAASSHPHDATLPPASATPPASPRANDSNGLPIFEPIRRFHLPGDPQIYGVTLSPDGRTMYVESGENAINIWEIVVYYWPETLGAISGAAAMLAGIAIRRVLSRPRIIGEPHCRNCNYCLKHAHSGICTECGKPILRPIIGRSRCRRLAPYVLPAAMILPAYAAMWAFQLPRGGAANEWCNWWSYGLEARASKHGIALAKWTRQVERLQVVDTMTGVIERTLFTRLLSNGVAPWFQSSVTPDGRGIIVGTRAHQLGLIDTRSGRVLRRLNGSSSSPMPYWRQFAGFDQSGQTAFLVGLDEAEKKSEVVRWSLQTGQSAVCIATDAFTYHGPRPSFWEHRFFLIPDASATKLLELPSNMSSQRDPGFTARTWDISNAPPRFESLAFESRVRNAPTFSSNACRFYVRSRNMALQAEELATKKSRPVQTPEGYSLGPVDSSNASIRRVAIPANDFRDPKLSSPYLIFDADKEAWIAICNTRNAGIYMDPIMSANGHFLVAKGFLKNIRTSTGYKSDLLIYDLRALP